MAPPNLSDKNTTAKPPKLLDQVRDKLRVKHAPARGTPTGARSLRDHPLADSIRTEQTYIDWIKRFIFFHGKRHPKDMGARDIEAFLTHLAVAGKVSAATQIGSDITYFAH